MRRSPFPGFSSCHEEDEPQEAQNEQEWNVQENPARRPGKDRDPEVNLWCRREVYPPDRGGQTPGGRFLNRTLLRACYELASSSSVITSRDDGL
jgi:hypothetical protein